MQDVPIIIMPGYFHSALKRVHKKNLAVQATYMLMQNLLDQPAGVLPVTTVTKEEAQEAYTDGYRDHYTTEIDEDIKGSEGMPLGVQVVGRRWEDEKVLGIMQLLERQLKYKQPEMKVLKKIEES